MITLIQLFAVLIIVAGLVILVRPALLLDFLDNHAEALWLQVVAIVARALLGLLLIDQADLSRFPLVIEIIGWISLTAAALLATMGHRNFARFMRWLLSFTRPWARAGGLAAAVFGAFLLYAFA